ncbi:hypothetical protein [Mailhella sp.]
MKPVMPDTLDEGLRWICADPRGRAVLKWFLAKCDVEGRVPTQDMHLAAWAESRRSLGMELRKAIARVYGRHKIIDIEEEDHG